MAFRNHFECTVNLRDWPGKKRNPSPAIFRTHFLFGKKFGSDPKTRAVGAVSSFRAYFRGFDQVDKTAHSSLGRCGKKSFSFAPI